MKTFVIDRYKSKDGGRIVDMPQPVLGDNDVLVEVHAAGVNLLDVKIADGEFKIFLPYRFPLVLGNDVAGVVVEVGSRVRRFKPGDEVYARPDQDRIGTFAEFIAMDEGDVAIKPADLTMEEAASVPLVGLTAWQALVEMAELKPGAEGLHPGGHRRCRNVRHPVGEASGGDGGYHGKRCQFRVGEGPRRGHLDRLQDARLRTMLMVTTSFYIVRTQKPWTSHCGC